MINISRLAFLFVCVLIAGCQDNSFVAPPLQSVTVINPEVGNVEYTLEYPGYTSSSYIVDLVARSSGFLNSKLYKSGSFVKEGDLLFVIEPQPYMDRVEICEANLSSANASLDLARAKLDRVIDASKSNAVSEMDVIKAKSDLLSCEADVKSAISQLNTAKTNLSYCYVKAPCNGHITDERISVGNYVNGQILATIHNDDVIRVSFYIEDSKYIQIIKNTLSINNGKGNEKSSSILGLKVDVILGDSSLVYKGAITYLDPSVDLSTGTIKLRVDVDNKNYKYALKNGFYVKVKIPYSNNPNAILIPDSSIGKDQSGSYVYTVGSDSVVKYQHIKTGVLRSDNTREIIEGLSKDDYIVSEALLKVRDGGKVIPIKK